MDRATNVTVSSEAYVFRLRTLARMCPLPGFSPPPQVQTRSRLHVERGPKMSPWHPL